VYDVGMRFQRRAGQPAGIVQMPNTSGGKIFSMTPHAAPAAGSDSQQHAHHADPTAAGRPRSAGGAGSDDAVDDEGKSAGLIDIRKLTQKFD
jgi:hypothetical protein